MMNVSPLQLDTGCFHISSHYYPPYYTNEIPGWTSSLLCPSTPTTYPSSSMPSALQSIENYCSIESYYPSGPEPLASSSDVSYHPQLSQYVAPVSGPHPVTHFYGSDECPTADPSSASSPPSGVGLPQNRANYTRHQLVMLNEIFKEHKYPNSLQKTLIAKYIGVSRDQIRIWFQNKRRKVQLINKGQAKKTKTDVECEFGEYRQHLPKNFLGDLFEELYKARGAPARLPVKRETNGKGMIIEQEPSSHPIYYTAMPSNRFYPTHTMVEHDDSSHGQQEKHISIGYAQPMY